MNLTKLSPEKIDLLLQGETVKDEKKQSLSFLRESSQGGFYIQINDLVIERVLILNTNYDLPIYFTGESQFDYIFIEGQAKITGLVFQDKTRAISVTTMSNAQIDKLIFTENVSIEDIDISGKSLIEEVRVHNNAQISWIGISGSAKVNNLCFLGNCTIGDVDIYETAKVKNIEINEFASCDEVNIGENSIVYDLDLKGDSKISEFTLSEKAILNVFEITENPEVTEIIFEGGKIENYIKFHKWTSNSALLRNSGTSFPLKFLIQDILIGQIRFIDFHVNSIIQISRLRANGDYQGKKEIEFQNCTFSKLELIDNSLDTFDRLVFKNSDITSCFLSQTSFPNSVASTSISQNSRASLKESHVQKKLFFEQVKTIYNRQGNKTESIIYQAKELNAHYTILNWNKNFWDKLTLWFNKNTTNFGTSWTRGFLALLVTTIPLFVLLLWSTKGVVAVWPWQMNSEDFGLYATQYFDFINPTSYIWKRWDFIYELEGGEVRWGVKLLLLFSKVLIVTIIYQIIQAFRKFGRK
ncbi:hypothetical protein AWW68_00975 [Roseivirga spongicola]|uniref:Uncharacterized protein n=1 Tax=Roseivirga spongicola TaxID=333140 RepID=A0A150XF81_9BACT|nr:hypothetical protein [Roseivirga spongicola]KYG77372.1 hypothetical protein AWW68_00975 [Roseivirga spongicola]